MPRYLKGEIVRMAEEYTDPEKPLLLAKGMEVKIVFLYPSGVHFEIEWNELQPNVLVHISQIEKRQ